MAREQIKMGDLVEQRERRRELEMVGIPRRIRHSLADFRVQLRTHSMKERMGPRRRNRNKERNFAIKERMHRAFISM